MISIPEALSFGMPVASARLPGVGEGGAEEAGDIDRGEDGGEDGEAGLTLFPSSADLVLRRDWRAALRDTGLL